MAIVDRLYVKTIRVEQIRSVKFTVELDVENHGKLTEDDIRAMAFDEILDDISRCGCDIDFLTTDHEEIDLLDATPTEEQEWWEYADHWYDDMRIKEAEG